jgi:hypothetical protein
LLFKDRNFIDRVLGGNIENIKDLINKNLNSNNVKEVFNKQKINQDKIQNQEQPAFFPSTYFQGVRNGYVFKTDNNGLGYYLDKK